MIACPVCGSEMSVRETRSHANCLRRRRYCDNLKCGHKVWTIETISDGIPRSDVVVIDKDAVARKINELRAVLGDISLEGIDDDDDDEPQALCECGASKARDARACARCITLERRPVRSTR